MDFQTAYLKFLKINMQNNENDTKERYNTKSLFEIKLKDNKGNFAW